MDKLLATGLQSQAMADLYYYTLLSHLSNLPSKSALCLFRQSALIYLMISSRFGQIVQERSGRTEEGQLNCQVQACCLQHTLSTLK
jgi:hypothetical protein